MNNPFENIEMIEVHGIAENQKVKIDISQILHFNCGNVLNDFAHLSSNYAYIAHLTHIAEKRAGEKQILLDTLLAKLSIEIRNEFEKNGKKSTENQIQSLINQNKDVIRLKVEQLEYDQESKLLSKLTRAVELKERVIKNFLETMKAEWFIEFARTKSINLEQLQNTGIYASYFKRFVETGE
jgi:hypothetical protein